MNGENQPPQKPQDEVQWQFKPEQPQASAPQPALATAEQSQPVQQTAVSQAPGSSAPLQQPVTPSYVTPEQEVSWTASEFIAHQKSVGWYLGLAGATVVLGGLVYLISRDRLSTAVIVIMAVLVGIAGSRQPRVMTYTLNNRGLTIGQKPYPFSEFKSFSIIDEGAFNSIMLMPLKRFMPPVNVYYDPQDENKIVDLFAGHLPLENRGHDPLDRLIRGIRF